MNLALIKSFAPIDLKGIKKAELMNRIDRKFVVPQHMISDILAEVIEYYLILEIDGKRMMNYLSVYFDTPGNEFYLAHHNGKLNRYKVRKRMYLDTGTCFLEIKFKNNKGKTQKSRILTTNDLFGFNESDLAFLKKDLPVDPVMLQPKISNQFLRITLVKKDMNERCTIDVHLNFIYNGLDTSMENLAIIEVKQEANSAKSPLVEILNQKHIHSMGFSKYCIGRVLTDNDNQLKYNTFKPKIRKIEKTIQV
ncbi:MAG TPA: VTC domain-containing protein [Marinilabiliales bacterium]|jgi:hypothetical protein|nr:MAG: hypothetical protein A2W95_19240 [Bacteroidetes bacterium GWA2_40_14]OFX62234.1 MAG: hypothetical protein A2W84_12240 [Bacteroidetes bacterium GWC2_40_13]OFX73790.1 MAG: hypothetical protein A2W96_07935 [Bacteroidetes bacterium GWD2_40_43]OFX89418.1 MAG: hypothetical protein A2W97_13755 [Bacteroidetes bacterium GWE2_40_63]OFY20736.1 MAG: hypothetical protein A2W88_05410 [Bacteroidetes bacterium GWF2_40_13]OFZ28147.1 MAG: hypothetical protein A2437_04580 [Bacteroidetes bacterium RIFOXYC